LLLFDQLVCYQPADTPRPERQALCPAPLFESRNPAPLGEAEPRFQRLVADIEAHGGEFVTSLAVAQSGAPSEGTVRDLVTQIVGQDNPDAADAELWDARLFLALAELRIIAEIEITDRLREVERRRQELLASLRNEKEIPPLEATGAEPLPDLDLGIAGLRAWATLHERDSQPATVLAGAPGTAGGYLVELAERRGHNPEFLARLGVPRDLDRDQVADWRLRLADGRDRIGRGLATLAAGDPAAARRLVADGADAWNAVAHGPGALHLFWLPGVSSKGIAALLRRRPAPTGGQGVVIAVTDPG